MTAVFRKTHLELWSLGSITSGLTTSKPVKGLNRLDADFHPKPPKPPIPC